LILRGFDGFFVCGLFLMPSAQVRRGIKITRMPFAEWQKICLDA
jgi:hypothetical protein